MYSETMSRRSPLVTPALNRVSSPTVRAVTCRQREAPSTSVPGAAGSSAAQSRWNVRSSMFLRLAAFWPPVTMRATLYS